jgi:hypothetical protein
MCIDDAFLCFLGEFLDAALRELCGPHRGEGRPGQGCTEREAVHR